jgi:Domain of unknown function (DUF4440)
MSADVEAAFETYIAAFETLELERALPLYDSPVVLITAQGVTAMHDPDVVRSQLSGMIAQLRSADYERTDFRDRRIQVLDENLALVSGLAVRIDSQGAEIGRFEAVYTLRRNENKWRVASIVIHDPPTS